METNGSLSTIVRDLARILIDLDRHCDRLEDPRASSKDGVATWEDENYIYAEVRVSQTLETQIDISSINNKLFIRMVRREQSGAQGRP